jgi:hypothetical protein
VNITRVEHSSSLNGGLDRFLTESFGVEENGMALSVLSAFARLGFDPWAEAARLAALPKQAAATAIASHLSLQSDSTIATRLAGLLPEHAVIAQAGSRMDRLHSALRRNILLVIVLWLLTCIFFVTISGPSETAEGPTASFSGQRGPISH